MLRILAKKCRSIEKHCGKNNPNALGVEFGNYKSVGTISVTIDDGLLVEFLDSKWWELWVVPLWWTRLVCGCGKIDNVKILT